MPHDQVPGRVLLVGAGPGAADLLTLRALRAIETAGAVLYDALVCDEVVALAPAACLKIQTGKRSGKASMDQAVINRLMLRLSRRGLTVVRLKGGDPSVFGRSGEEREFLEGHGVPVDIIPGVTAASAAAAQFAFPLTHRGEARRVVLATGRLGGGGLATGDPGAFADPETTVVFYMGRDVAAQAADAMTGAGRAPATPALVVENAGRPDARCVRTDLDGLAQAAALCTGPTLLIVGPVAARARLPAAAPAELEEAPAVTRAAMRRPARLPGG